MDTITTDSKKTLNQSTSGKVREKKVYSGIFVVISMIYITCLLISNLIAGKLWAIGSITLPAAVILFPITYILGDVFTEVYGFASTRTVIWSGFACSFFAVLVYSLTVILPHPSFWEGQEAFATVLGTTWRIALASFAGYLFGEFSNSMILSKLKVKTKGKNLWLRTILSTIVGELFDSVIFITIAFVGTVETSALLQMILVQYIFKVLYEALFTPVTYAAVRFIKKKENVDTYDEGIKYNII